jgi:hypothetical protein
VHTLYVKTKIYEQGPVFDNGEMRLTFGPKRDKVTGWGKPHNEELHSLDSSPIIIRMLKSGRVRWEGHIACLERRVMHTEYSCDH